MSALECLSRHLYIDGLHGWNLGQPLILSHEIIDLRELLKQFANSIVLVSLIENHLTCANFSKLQNRGYRNQRTLDAEVNILIDNFA